MLLRVQLVQDEVDIVGGLARVGVRGALAGVSWAQLLEGRVAILLQNVDVRDLLTKVEGHQHGPETEVHRWTQEYSPTRGSRSTKNYLAGCSAS